jgi:hypothetical protein
MFAYKRLQQVPIECTLTTRSYLSEVSHKMFSNCQEGLRENVSPAAATVSEDTYILFIAVPELCVDTIMFQTMPEN